MRSYVSDIDMTVNPQSLLDTDYLRERATLIDRDRARPASAGTPRGGTVYLTAADASSAMVSMIQSNYMGFGSGVVVPGTGIACRTAARILLCTGAPNQAGPGKRPYTPSSRVSDQGRRCGDELRGDGWPDATAGSRAGGGAHRRPRPESTGGLRRPTVPLGARPSVCCEPGFPPSTLDELQRRGHQLVTTDDYSQFGSSRRSGASTTDLRRSATSPRRPGGRLLNTDLVFGGRQAIWCESGSRATELIRGSRRRLNGPQPDRVRCPPPTGRGRPTTRSRLVASSGSGMQNAVTLRADNRVANPRAPE